MSPEPIFGTASFGMDGTEFQDEASVADIITCIKELGVTRLDSGARYPPLRPGRSEELIGLVHDHSADLLVDTKVYADTRIQPNSELTAEAIEQSVTGSLARLQRSAKGVNVLHIHRADPSTPIREQVRAFSAQIKAGRCKAWGVSNVPVPMLEEMLGVCDEEGLIKPQCYQGEYNVITRGAETELFPLLRKHGMVFNAFRPLAAGFLTGSLTTGNTAGTRFSDENPVSKLLSNIFGAEDLNREMRKFLEATAAHSMTSVEVALRWIFYHSGLGKADGVILGGSKRKQVEESLAFIRKGALPADVVEIAEHLWAAVKKSRGHIY